VFYGFIRKLANLCMCVCVYVCILDENSPRVRKFRLMSKFTKIHHLQPLTMASLCNHIEEHRVRVVTDPIRHDSNWSVKFFGLRTA